MRCNVVRRNVAEGAENCHDVRVESQIMRYEIDGDVIALSAVAIQWGA